VGAGFPDLGGTWAGWCSTHSRNRRSGPLQPACAGPSRAPCTRSTRWQWTKRRQRRPSSSLSHAPSGWSCVCRARMRARPVGATVHCDGNWYRHARPLTRLADAQSAGGSQEELREAMAGVEPLARRLTLDPDDPGESYPMLLSSALGRSRL
jgi:hypothetical protein